MKNKKIFFLSAVATCMLVLFAFPGRDSFAAEPIQLQKTEAFKNYKFGSIDVSLFSDTSQVIAGSTMHIKAEIKNANDYPITEGNLFIKIFKKQDPISNQGVNYFKELPPADFLANGDFLTDQWIVQKSITLKANETKNIAFDYKISDFAESGEYRFIPYFQVAQRWNLLGLPFTEDVGGAPLETAVKNGQTSSGVEFQKNDVKLQGKQFHFIGFIKSYPTDQSVDISAPLRNSSSEQRQVKVTWEVFYWHNLPAAKPFEKKEEVVSLGAGETKNLTFAVSKNDLPVNYMVVTADYKGTKSILNIRFARQTQAKARINFAGIQKFPEPGANKIFATAHLVTEPTLLPSSILNETAESIEARAEEEKKGIEVEREKTRERDEKIRALLSSPPKKADGMLDKEKLDVEMKKLQAMAPDSSDTKAMAEDIAQVGGGPQSPAYRLVLDLKNETGNLIQSFEYEGTLAGEVSGFEAPFDLKPGYSKILLTARVFNSANQLQDETTIAYDCAEIDSEKCPSRKFGFGSSAVEKRTSLFLTLALLVVLVLVATAIIIYVRRKKKKDIVFPDRKD